MSELYAQVASRYGRVVSGERIEQHFRDIWDRPSAAVQEGHPAATDASDRAWWRQLVWEAFSREGGVDSFEPFFTEAYEQFYDPAVWRIYPEVPSALSRFSAAGCRLAVVSNWSSRLEPMLIKMEIRDAFELVVASAVHGAAKPDPRIFDAALKRMGVRPDEAVHVGDSVKSDVHGALRSGIQAVWLCRDQSSEVSRSEMEKLTKRGVFVARDLDEAATLVLC
jgi:putative hydrolase of the HAD superfamily